jgi:Protein of Unknown function (DUF2784)
VRYRALADGVVVVHFAFVAFVVLGGLLALRWRRAVWVHLPAAAWGVFVEYSGIICPLTPLEIALRERGRELGYRGDFVSHYVLRVLYPSGLTRQAQFVLGSLALAFNMAVYAAVIRRARRARRTPV